MARETYEGYLDNQEAWRQMLTGAHPQMRRGREFWGHVPSHERCKMCNAPYDGLGGVVSRMRGRGPSNWHPRICMACESFSKDHPGGVELDISVAFVDVRDSTRISDTMDRSVYVGLLNRFYGAATKALTDADAIIDKLVGDEVMALFLPAFAGEDHAAKAISGCLDIMTRVGYGTPDGPFVEIGAGVNTGTAYIGVVGANGTFKDFTALGDEINLAARLAQSARSGEVLVGPTSAERSATTGDQREVDAKGFDRPIAATVLHI